MQMPGSGFVALGLILAGFLLTGFVVWALSSEPTKTTSVEYSSDRYQASAELREAGGASDRAAGRSVGFTQVLVLLLITLSPAVVYQIRRGTKVYPVCAACGGREVVPPDSPRGRQIQDQASASAG